MEQDTQQHTPQAPTGMEDVAPAAPTAAAPPPPADERGEAAVEAFARNHEGLEEKDERDALDWLLGSKPQVEYGVPVTLLTESGDATFTWVIRQMDGRKIDGIEARHRNEMTGKYDRIGADCDVAAEATVCLQSESGRKLDPKSEEFRTMRVRDTRNGEVTTLVHPSAGEAIAARFRLQLGVVSGVASEVRRISGYDPEKVGSAKRRLVVASGN
jgi:hypothetical protein